MYITIINNIAMNNNRKKLLQFILIELSVSKRAQLFIQILQETQKTDFFQNGLNRFHNRTKLKKCLTV